MQHEMQVINEKGDTRLSWDEENRTEVDAARKMFDDMKAKGYIAYKMNKQGDKGDLIDRFDPSHEKVVLAPPMRGG
jgi:hypothetical protein